MHNTMPTYIVRSRSGALAHIAAVSYRQAVERARRRYGPFVDVELHTTREASARDRALCNARQQAKTARRYPTDGFEARRAELIAAHKG